MDNMLSICSCIYFPNLFQGVRFEMSAKKFAQEGWVECHVPCGSEKGGKGE